MEFKAKTIMHENGGRVHVSLPTELLDALDFKPPYHMIARLKDYVGGITLLPDNPPVEEAEPPRSMSAVADSDSADG